MEEKTGEGDAQEPLDLAVRTRRFALAIIKLSRAIPKNDEAGSIMRRQLLRSGTSIGAQYREGRRARSSAEYVSKLESSLQELDETGYWIELLRDAELIKPSWAERYLAEVEELICIFVTCVKSAKG